MACTAGPPVDTVTADTGSVDDTGSPHDTGSVPTGPTLRVVTWNLEVLGSPGTLQYEAAVAVLRRLDGDVVGINEIDVETSDPTALNTLADTLGYSVVRLGGETPFGPLRNAMLARSGVARSPAAAVLSGDANAEDTTRAPVVVTLEPPWGGTLAVSVQHAKAGFDDIDEFRRIVDLWRTAQAAWREDADHVVVVGDMNEDPLQRTTDPLFPRTFTEVPPGQPSSFRLGQDLRSRLSDGIDNDPFAWLQAEGLELVDAAQLDGRIATRDSGRWIDHVMIDPSLVVVASEIYDSTDEGQAPGIPKVGDPLPRETVRDAADHLPVVVDLTIRDW